MKSLWDPAAAGRCAGELALRVYSSRLLGREPSLVLHGGGNTSLKQRETNRFGETEEILYVKGSGWDLAVIEAAGFTPLRLAGLLKLAGLAHLGDREMVEELRLHQTRSDAPAASVEAILHALLPYRFVDHTHADALVTLTNSRDGEARIRQIYGDRVVVIPYVMPGFELARCVAQRFPAESHPDTLGIVLMNHGLFSFGETAQVSYQRMMDLVTLAEDYLCARGAWTLPVDHQVAAPQRQVQATLRRAISQAAGDPMVLCATPGGLDFARHPAVESISQRGPATPDHVIRTKPWPLTGRGLAGFIQRYQAYFDTHAATARTPVTRLDPAPRVILDPELGLLTAGRSVNDALIAADIYRQTIGVILRAEALGGYQALPARDLFDVEYWELEQAKLARAGARPPLQGEVALVTGAASGIGRACAEVLHSQGAAVVALDRNPAVEDWNRQTGGLGLTCDVTDPAAVSAALDQMVRTFGGLDMLILNAGVFPGGCLIADLTDQAWSSVLSVNLDANLRLLREGYPLLKLAPRYGRVVIIGSKNVAAPGPGAAAYSAAKAALNQLARVAALEWAADGIRVNVLHPDAVFDTGLWNPEVLESRARHYGLTVEQYRRKNLLKTEITSRDVAKLAAALCGPLFAKTTAAQIPVDGGNERVI